MKAQQEAIDEGSEKADSLTDVHLMQTVMDMFTGEKIIINFRLLSFFF